MNNFPIKLTHDVLKSNPHINAGLANKTVWVSRSMAVAVFVFRKVQGNWYILANKRGEGCPDYVGYWSCPCGYVDYNESIIDAAARELYEESGIDLRKDKYLFELSKINCSMNSLQNITFRFKVLYGKGKLDTFPDLTDIHSENNEIEDQEWIALSNIGDYIWAFDHDKIILDTFSELYSSNHYDIFC